MTVNWEDEKQAVVDPTDNILGGLQEEVNDSNYSKGEMKDEDKF